MLVVSDASPLNILIRCGETRVLPVLFGSVAIPPAVRSELTADRTPPEVKSFVEAPPEWLSVRAPMRLADAGSKGLGEREAIMLAAELGADALLVDDLRARREARGRGLEIIGTLGVLQRAAARELLDLEPSISKARRLGLMVSDDLVKLAIHRDRLRRGE